MYQPPRRPITVIQSLSENKEKKKEIEIEKKSKIQKKDYNYAVVFDVDSDDEEYKKVVKEKKLIKEENKKEIVEKKSIKEENKIVEKKLIKENKIVEKERKKEKDVVNFGLPSNETHIFDLDPSLFDDKINLSVIYCDGACNKDTGDSAWGSVVNSESLDLIALYKYLLKDLKYEHKQLEIKKEKVERDVIIAKATDVKSQQNNYAELLSFLFALQIANHTKKVKEIRSDSQLIINYWSNPKHNTSLTKDENKNKYIKLCKNLRLEFENNGGKITKVSGSDNLADLGKHKN